MNTTIKCIDQLVTLLPEPENITQKTVIKSLETYQAQMRNEINHLLHSNHQMGLSMDRFDKEQKLKEIHKYIELEKNQKKGVTYRMNSAGYGINH